MTGVVANVQVSHGYRRLEKSYRDKYGEGDPVMAGKQHMPPTVRRSPQEAQETWIKAHDSAADQYGEGDRAQRTAYTALQHKYEKVGDRWRRKVGRRQDVSGGSGRRGAKGPRPGPAVAPDRVDPRASKHDLYSLARELEVAGRSRMTKDQLVEEIRKAKRRRAAKERRRART